LDDIKWLKYLGGGVEMGLFSSLLGVSDDYRILTWKVCAGKWSWSIFAWRVWENPEKLQSGVQFRSWISHRAPPVTTYHSA